MDNTFGEIFDDVDIANKFLNLLNSCYLLASAKGDTTFVTKVTVLVEEYLTSLSEKERDALQKIVADEALKRKNSYLSEVNTILLKEIEAKTIVDQIVNKPDTEEKRVQSQQTNSQNNLDIPINPAINPVQNNTPQTTQNTQIR